MTYKAPDPGKGWRLLKVGEVKPPDTEFLFVSDPSDKWDVCPTKGLTVTEMSQQAGLLYRTREGVKPVKEINYQRLALRISKAKTIREAREIYKKGVGK